MPAPADEDHYAVLGVSVGIDARELRRTWRQLAMRWHPDRAGAEATARFQRLAAAYAVLSDPAARAAYDRRRGMNAPSPSPRPAPGTAPAAGVPKRPSRRPAPAVMLHRLSGPLGSLRSSGAVRLEEPGFITLALHHDEAEEGGMASVSMRVEVWCPTCGGSPSAAIGCARCEGKRIIRELYSAWVAVPPGVADGEELKPSVALPGMLEPVRFRVRVRPPTSAPRSS